MSGLILCQRKTAVHPFYVEELGIQIYTAEELCYVIYNHIFIVQEERLTERLVEFMGEELDYMDSAMRLYKKSKDIKRSDEVLIEILKEIPYYTPGEIGAFREWLSKFRRQHPAVQQVEKGDYYLKRKRFLKAVDIYETSLFEYGSEIKDILFVGNLYMRLGNAYGALFEAEKAKRAYINAYQFLREKEVLKRMYYLTALFDVQPLPELIVEKVSPAELKMWEQEVDDIRMDVMAGEQIANIHHQFQKDSLKRKAALEQQFDEWKNAYRKMI